MESTKRPKGKLAEVLLSLLGTLSVAAFPPLFLYFQNAGEAHFSDVSSTLLWFLAVGCALFALFALVTRKPAKAGLIAALFLLVFLNYAPIEKVIQKVLPFLRYWHIAPLLLVILLHLGWVIWKLLPDELAGIITPVMGLMFCGLILINGVTSIPTIQRRIQAEQTAARLAQEERQVIEVHPNFYFLLFDEFSTIPVMEKYFGYDNSAMVRKLESLGFVSSQTGHNDSYATAVVTANLFNLDYLVTDLDSAEKQFAVRSDSLVFSILREAGYSITAVGEAPFYGLPDAVGEKQKGATTAGGENMNVLLMLNTVLYPGVERFVSDAAQEILNDLAYLKDPEHFADSNQFILAHINCPHAPFYFNADGSISDVVSEWTNLDAYVNQSIFSSNEMVAIAETIIDHDPNAIIWILSDHSARGNANQEMANRITAEDKKNFFSTLYYQGEKLDIEGLSGVNTFRLILNKLLGTTFEMIPLPSEKT